MTAYEAALARGRQAGAGRCDDAAAMALYCESVLQQVVGAAAPRLVWEGAQKSGLTYLELGRMCVDSPRAVHDLMWL